MAPLLDGALALRAPGGVEREAQLRNGVPDFRQSGVEHDVLNANDFGGAFIEIAFL